MHNSSIGRDKPRIQSIFGNITESEDAEIRTIFNKTDEQLHEFAKYFSPNLPARWEKNGLELVFSLSGQMEISSTVGTGLDGDHKVEFNISLEPGWMYGDFPLQPNWRIEARIYADCQHKIYHESMDLVFNFPRVIKNKPVEAAIALLDMTKAVAKLGMEKPIDYWLKLASDNPT